jgi:hypothetical protein
MHLRRSLEELRKRGGGDYMASDDVFRLLTTAPYLKQMADAFWARCGKLHDDIVTLEMRKDTAIIQGRKALFMDLERRP